MNTFEEDEDRILLIKDPTCFYKIKPDHLDIWNNSFLKDISNYLLTKDDIQEIIIDMENVKRVDSSAFEILIRMFKTSISINKKVVFVNIGKELYKIISMLGLDAFFTIMNDPFDFPCESIENK